MNIYIKEKILKKIKYYVDISQVEISGLGTVEEINGDFLINDIFLLKQVNTGTSTQIDSGDIAELIMKLETEGKDSSKLRFWWHSHVNMNAFWSGVDTNTIENLCLDKYLISLVINKKNEYLARFDLNEPTKISLDKIQLIVIDDEDEDLYEQCRKDVEEKTK